MNKISSNNSVIKSIEFFDKLKAKNHIILTPITDNLLSCLNMKKLCLFISISLCSWLGWKAGAHLGIMTAYWVSFIGSLFGVVLGVLINRKFLDY